MGNYLMMINNASTTNLGDMNGTKIRMVKYSAMIQEAAVEENVLQKKFKIRVIIVMYAGAFVWVNLHVLKPRFL